MRDEPTARMSPGRMVVVRSPRSVTQMAALPKELALTGAAADVRIEDAAVRWVEVPRYSRKQARPMTFGGWMGWVRYADVPCSLLPLLRAAEGLHVGKHTAFGFGAITLGDTGGALTGA